MVGGAESVMAKSGIGFSAELGRRFGSEIYDAIRRGAKKATVLTKEVMEIGFSEFIASNTERCANVKTIINRYERVPLLNIYEDCLLSIGDKSSPESEVTIDYGGNIIIRGSAGSGKSFLMKRTFLRMIEINRGYVPIFFELRSLNDSSKVNLLESLFDFMPPDAVRDKNLLDRMLQKGRFVFLLDGYDELYEKIKQKVSTQIERIIGKYPRCRIIISGRSSESFEAWQHFNVYTIEPLTKKSCLSLIGKAIFPDEEKERFYRNVDESLFDTHGQYLSNPLMTYVMMMTADKFNEFPREMSSFYAKAFETLYSGHDILKSNQFKREVKCGLKFTELETILRYFCAVSYADSIFEYDDRSVIKYLEMALTVAKIDKMPEDVLDDITGAYCILIRDGLKYAYIHRSFQEYFAALGVSSSHKIDFFEYNDKVLSAQREINGYIEILSEIAKEKFVSEFLIRALEKYVHEMDGLVKASPKNFVLRHLEEYGVSGDGSVSYIVFPREVYRRNYALVVEVLPFIDSRFAFRPFHVIEEIRANCKGVETDPERNRLLNDDTVGSFMIEKMLKRDILKLRMYRYFKDRLAEIKNYVREVNDEYQRDRLKIQSMRQVLFSKK